MPVHTFAKLPLRALINGLKNWPQKTVNCVKLATFGSMTYFLKVGQSPKEHFGTSPKLPVHALN